MPNAHEVSRVDDYIRLTLYGSKPNASYLAQPHFQLQEASTDRILMTVFYYHYTSDFHTAQQHNYNGTPYYTELDKCTIGPSWCSFNALTPTTPSDWHPADYRVYNVPHQVNLLSWHVVSIPAKLVLHNVQALMPITVLPLLASTLRYHLVTAIALTARHYFPIFNAHPFPFVYFAACRRLKRLLSPCRGCRCVAACRCLFVAKCCRYLLLAACC